MELLQGLSIGLASALTPESLLYCLFGVFIGTLIGVLPGIGPIAAIAMLLPVTFGLPAVSALIMLAGIYYGAQYGGSTTAILVNVPGEVSSAVTAIDGYEMAKKGEAGKALAAAAISSFTAGTIATFVIVIFAPILILGVLKFGPAEYFSLMVLGLVVSIVLARGSVLLAVGMMLFGLLLGLVGTDPNSGATRFAFGQLWLADQIDITTAAMGLYGVGEVIRNLVNGGGAKPALNRLTGLMPSWQDLKRIINPSLRGTAVGSILGVLPGGGAVLASFAAYTLEKKIADKPERFGRGAIEGVAGPEAANNAGAQTAFIPMLSLGIPSNPIMALMIGALIIQGVQPGPNVMTQQPELFWGIIASMWVGNLMLVVLNLPLVGLWARLVSVPYHIIFPVILAFCCIGTFAVSNSVWDVFLMAGFGLVGYFLVSIGCELAPLLLGFVLGPMLEENLRRAMNLSRGDPTVFITEPISAVLLATAVLFLALLIIPSFVRTREEAFVEDD